MPPTDTYELVSELQEIADYYRDREVQMLLELAFENFKDRTIKTEEAMRNHLRNKQWTVLDLPGRSWNSPGPDALAFKNGSLLLLDNKAFLSPSGSQRAVGSASGLSPQSLAKNLPALITQVRAMPNQDPRLLAQLLATQAAAASAAASGRPMQLPKKVQRVVTNAGGRSPGLAPTMRAAGFKFIDLARRMAGLSPTALGL